MHWNPFYRATVNGTYIGLLWYYSDSRLAKKLLPDIFRISQGEILSFNRTVHWRIEHKTPRNLKLSTFVFNKVLHEWGEVENAYTCISYNFSPFYLPLQHEIIKIDGELMKFWRKQFCTVFSETRCTCIITVWRF